MAEQSLNVVNITGKIVEIENRTGVTRTGADYLAGTVKVEVGPDNIIPVDFFATRLTKAGKENGIYKSLDTVVKEYKTIQQHTREHADTVRITGARLEENIFFTENGARIRNFRTTGAFFNRGGASDEVKGEFIVTGDILEIVDDIKDDEPTGTVTVRMLVIGYADRGNVLDFTIEDPAGVNYAKTTFAPGMEVKLSGRVIIDETITEVKEDTAFGDPIVRTSRTTERKLILDSATAPIDSSLPAADRNKILASREADINEKKAQAQAPKSASKSTGAFSL